MSADRLDRLFDKEFSFDWQPADRWIPSPMVKNHPSDGYDKLPTERGAYRVETISGTVHIIERAGRITWKRLPGRGSMTAAHDNRAVPLSELGPGWEVGKQGYLVVADETYLTGNTWHLTGIIVSITAEDRP